MRRRTALATIGGLGVATALGVPYLARQAERQVDLALNRTRLDPDAPLPTAADRRLHAAMFIADLHADPLKWDRDLLVRSDYGHVDIPRLREGNVALEVFAMVTQSPMNLPWTACLHVNDPNHAALLAAVQGRPVFSTRGRAFHQMDKFHDAVLRSRQRPGEELRAILNASDLGGLIAARTAGDPVTGGLLGLEGGHWVGQEDASEAAVRAEMQALYEAGLRIFAPVHRFDNPLCGSSEGCERYGLTAAGRLALRMAEEYGMIVDMAHGSEAAIIDAAGLLREPFIVSHTGVRAVCAGPCRLDRNLSDDSIRHVLDSGGLIGIGFWPQAVGIGVHNIPRAMAHVMEIADTMGLRPSRHVGLGSDYDGSVVAQIPVERLDILTAVLRAHGSPFDDPEVVADIMGRNVLRLFSERLPGGSARLAEAHLRSLPPLPV